MLDSLHRTAACTSPFLRCNGLSSTEEIARKGASDTNTEVWQRQALGNAGVSRTTRAGMVGVWKQLPPQSLRPCSE